MGRKRILLYASLGSITLHLLLFLTISPDTFYSSPTAEKDFGRIELDLQMRVTSPSSSAEEKLPKRIAKEERTKKETQASSKLYHEILSKIRQKIARHKFYPRIAKYQQIEGSPQLEFQIKSDGQLSYVKIATSSGSPILDKAAIETLKKASPLPYYQNPIFISIRYSLE